MFNIEKKKKNVSHVTIVVHANLAWIDIWEYTPVKKPFKCELCDYHSAHKSALNKHGKYETTYRWKNIWNMTRDYRYSTYQHVKLQMVEKHFKYESCECWKVQKSYITWHDRTNTDEKSHKCLACYYINAWFSTLIIHISMNSS